MEVEVKLVEYTLSLSPATEPIKDSKFLIENFAKLFNQLLDILHLQSRDFNNLRQEIIIDLFLLSRGL